MSDKKQFEDVVLKSVWLNKEENEIWFLGTQKYLEYNNDDKRQKLEIFNNDANKTSKKLGSYLLAERNIGEFIIKVENECFTFHIDDAKLILRNDRGKEIVFEKFIQNNLK